MVFVYLLFPKQQPLSSLGYCAPLRFGSFGIYSDDLACSLSAASISTTYFLRYPTSQDRRNSRPPVIDVIKPMRCFAVRFLPYAASGSVKLTCVMTMLDTFLRP